MKFKTSLLVLLIGVFLVLSAGYEHGFAQPGGSGSGKIGVISVRQIFEQSKKNADYREQTGKEQQAIVADLEQLQAEIESSKARLNTLKPGSEDYLNAMKELMEKQAMLEAQKQYQEQRMGLKDQRWTEDLYKQILAVTQQVAAEKGLDLVLEQGRVEFPSASPNELMLTIRTHKLLYSEGCVDITDEVMARMDEQD
jgi:Skp family chaperone for outer membrane proteins